jgi:hypothetical protein
MGIISRSILVEALTSVELMTSAERERLIEQIRLEQPNLLLSVLVPARWGASHQQMAHLLTLLLTLFTAVKMSGRSLPLVTIEARQQYLVKLVRRLGLEEGLFGADARLALRQAVHTHLQPWLLAHVCSVMEEQKWFDWPDETRSHLVLAGLGLLECIARGMACDIETADVGEAGRALQMFFVRR